MARPQVRPDLQQFRWGEVPSRRMSRRRNPHRKALAIHMDLDTIDADAKLVMSWLVGGRDSKYAMAFMDDLSRRLANRVQRASDGHRATRHTL